MAGILVLAKEAGDGASRRRAHILTDKQIKVRSSSFYNIMIRDHKPNKNPI